MPRRRFGQGRSEFYGDTFVLAEVSKSLFEKFEPVGTGEDWRYDRKRSFGKALRYGADLIHFSAFGKQLVGKYNSYSRSGC
jgi:hypothetical protein